MMKRVLLATTLGLLVCTPLWAEEANPKNTLKDAYSNYITVKVCHDMQNEHMWISDAQMNRAKRYVSAIDKKLHLSNTEDIWKELNTKSQAIQDSIVTATNTNLMASQQGWRLVQSGCQNAYNELRKISNSSVKP